MTIWNKAHPDSNSGQGWLKTHPVEAALHRRRATLKRSGTTPEEVDKTWELQNGACANANCAKTFPKDGSGKKRLHADHDHRTGRFRGLLCARCNLALGTVDDDMSKLEGLIAYLRLHAEALN